MARDAYAVDPVELSWLVTVRWAGIVAAATAIGVGADFSDPRGLLVPLGLVAAAVASNGWLAWRSRLPRPTSPRLGGWLVAADVVSLSIILRYAGGVLNPASIFYLVDIVLAALVLGRTWAWVMALLSIGGYGVLFLAPPSALAVAGSMHPEIGAHVRGMWLAFAATASIVAVLVSRLAAMVERRDRAIEALRDRAARDSRLAALTTMSAGAAHELSTPLATIAVAAREVERALATSGGSPEIAHDIGLIRAEVDRCRRVLEDMAARVSEPIGEMPARIAVREVVERAVAALAPDDRSRVSADDVPASLSATWPVSVVSRALVNILRNAAQASHADARISVGATPASAGLVRLVIADQGTGMSAAVRDRAGEPFFTTKPGGQGMGLGLFVTRSTIEQLGGSLVIESQPGRGTTVTVTLPAQPALIASQVRA